MTDPIKSCANCGHGQATGDFCEACGTRLPAAAAVAAAGTGGAVTPPAVAGALAGAPTVPAAATTPPPYLPPVQPQSQPEVPQAGAPQYGAAPAAAYQPPQAAAYQPPQAPYAPPQYAAPRPPSDDVWTGLGDFTFRRFPTPGLVRLAWIIAMIWVALSLIVSLWVISDGWGGGLSVFLLLKAIAVAVFTLLIVRVGLEAALAVHRIREKKE